MENIQQFMRFVTQEEKKWRRLKQKKETLSKTRLSKRGSKSPSKNATIDSVEDEDEKDSVSDITELDKKEILTKYY